MQIILECNKNCAFSIALLYFKVAYLLSTTSLIIDNKEVTDNDLQKAIQNSLREQGPAGLGGQISAEEQELSR